MQDCGFRLRHTGGQTKVIIVVSFQRRRQIVQVVGIGKIIALKVRNRGDSWILQPLMTWNWSPTTRFEDLGAGMQDCEYMRNQPFHDLQRQQHRMRFQALRSVHGLRGESHDPALSTLDSTDRVPGCLEGPRWFGNSKIQLDDDIGLEWP